MSVLQCKVCAAKGSLKAAFRTRERRDAPVRSGEAADQRYPQYDALRLYRFRMLQIMCCRRNASAAQRCVLTTWMMYFYTMTILTFLQSATQNLASHDSKLKYVCADSAREA